MLEEVLRSAGINSLDELNAAERETFARWSKALQNAQDMSLEDFRQVVYNEMVIVDRQLIIPDLPPMQELFWKVQKRTLMLFNVMLNDKTKGLNAVQSEIDSFAGKKSIDNA